MGTTLITQEPRKGKPRDRASVFAVVPSSKTILSVLTINLVGRGILLCSHPLLPRSSGEPYIFLKLPVHFGHLSPICQAWQLPCREGTALALSVQGLPHRFLRGVYSSQRFGRDLAQSLSRRPLREPKRREGRKKIWMLFECGV